MARPPARTGSRPTNRSSAPRSPSPATPNRTASAPRSRPGDRRSASPIPPPTRRPSSPPPNRPPPAWAAAAPETRVGLLLEALVRLNAMSFEMGNAVMHTTGQAFPMAFQAGGPHAQDRGLEAVATAWAEMSPRARHAPSGRSRRARPRPSSSRSTGASCRAASRSSSAARPSRPGTAIPASSPASPPATPVIVKPHPGAILPLALTVAVLRDLLAEAGPAARRRPARRRRGRGAGHQGPRPPPGGRDRRLHRLERLRRLGARERRRGAGLHRGGRRQLDRHRRHRRLRRHVRQRRLLARALLGPDVHRPAGHLRPQGRHRHRRGPQVLRRGRRRHRRRGRRAPRRPGPRRGRLPAPSPTRRPSTASPPRAASAAIVRDSAPLAEGRSATPLIVAVDAADEAAYGEERFGPIAFLVAVDDADDGIARAAGAREAQGRDHRRALRHRRGAHPRAPPTPSPGRG